MCQAKKWYAFALHYATVEVAQELAKVRNMARLLRITEIQEFTEVGRIPEAAVTEEILSNVALLDEKTQLELWIQEIIRSHDQTPHGPTEIADIISTRVTVGGIPKYTAFILKGKSFQKVRAKDVAHQITRLRRLEGVELAVFVAVGDIQDDVYDEFIHQALELGCDYLVVTKFDLARLLVAYDKICEKDGLSFDNGTCPQGHPQRREIVLRYKVREAFQWELLKLQDASHGLAKRLAATVLTDKHFTQDALRTVISEVVPRIRTDTYVRSKLVATQWGNSPAHVVWVYLGLDMDDVKDSNWICMACWIDPDLKEDYRPAWHYDELHDGIMLKWNSDYHAMKRLWSRYTGGKHDVIRRIEKIVEQIQPLVELLDLTFTAFQQGAVTELSFTKLIQSKSKQAEKLQRESSDCPSPPLECVDYSQRFHSAMACFSNLFLVYTSDVFLNERTSKNRSSLFNSNLTELKGLLRKLEYEREKL